MGEVSSAEIELELLRAMHRNQKQWPWLGIKSDVVLREALIALAKWTDAANCSVCMAGNEDPDTKRFYDVLRQLVRDGFAGGCGDLRTPAGPRYTECWITEKGMSRLGLDANAERFAFINGRFVPAAKAVVPIHDAGFMLGATVSEQLRSFGGKLFRLEQHIERLWHSLSIVEVVPDLLRDEFYDVAAKLVQRNHPLLADGDDLGLTIFVTPGPYATYVPEGGRPLVCMHTFPLPFRLWAELYTSGQSLRVPQVRQVPPQCWPAELKCRSRMHYYLADRQARAAEPGARALLLDLDGKVVESSTANVVLLDKEGRLVSPPREKILPGISVGVLAELSERLGVPLAYRDLEPADVAAAREVFLTSTSPCLLPVTRFEGSPIGDGKPGEMFHRLLAAWSEEAGLDIAAQARQFARR